MRRLRIALILAVSVLLHVALLGFIAQEWRIEPDAAPLPTTIEARIDLTPVRPEPKVVAPAAKPVAPKPSVAKPVPVAPATPVADVPIAVPDAAGTVAPGPTASAATPGSSTGTDTPASTEATPGLDTSGMALASGWSIKSYPPDGSLLFKATLTEPAQNDRVTYGKGTISWEHKGDRYRIEQDIGIDLIFTTVAVQGAISQGRTGPAGLAPDSYVESRRRRDATTTTFDRTATPPMIRFSVANTPAVAMPPDSQDRASALFQLSVAMRNLPDHVQRGDIIEMTLTGPRKAEPWQFVIEGEQLVESGLGALPAIKLIRHSTPESKDPQLEIWFAPANEWLPVRIRYTENDGKVLDLVVNGWKAVDIGKDAAK
ncbi:hypothetical protein BH10PSE17_BH10PSE17_26390 [soil metagenome]